LYHPKFYIITWHLFTFLTYKLSRETFKEKKGKAINVQVGSKEYKHEKCGKIFT